MSNQIPSGFPNVGSVNAQFSKATTPALHPVPGQVRMPRTPNPAIADSYNASVGSRGRPVLFQVVDPTNQPIWQYLLAMHVNPQKFSEKMTKSKNVVMTVGGFVEFIWPDELDTISADASTGAFMGPLVGLTAGSDGYGGNVGGRDSRPGGSGRKGTMAWERQEDLLDLFRSNGNVFDGNGKPVIRGRVMCIYDRGIFIGHFESFSPKEDDSHPYSFEISFEFKVEATIYRFPNSQNAIEPGASASLMSQAARTDVTVDGQSTNPGPSVPGATSADVANFIQRGSPTLDNLSGFNPATVLANNQNTNR